MNSQNRTPDDSKRPDSSPADGSEAVSGSQPTEPIPSSTAPTMDQPFAPAPGSVPGSGSSDFFGWVRGHGIHRGDDRWLGGVCAGIAHRLGVDPLIIRGVFIVLTLLAGIGVLAYGLAWALLPEPDGRIHAQEAGAGRWSTGMTGALIASILGLTGLGGGFWGWGGHGLGGFLWTIFWMGGAIYLVYYLAQRNRNQRATAGLGTPSNQTTAQSPGYPTSTLSGTAPGYPSQGAFPAYGPPASGPTYAASAYDTKAYDTKAYSAGTASYTAPGYAPQYGAGSGGAGTPGSGIGGHGRTPQPPRPHKPRPAGPGAPAVAIASGAALLVGGSLKALDATHVINLGDSVNAIAWASAAAVLGLGILIAGLRGRTAGILSFFAVVALVIGGFFNLVGHGDRVRFQDVAWSPATLQDARNGFDVTAGRGTIDLTSLAANAPLRTDVVIPLDVTAANITVLIPDNVPVQINADMTMGNINANRDGNQTYNADQPGSRLVVTIDGTFSNITIQERKQP